MRSEVFVLFIEFVRSPCVVLFICCIVAVQVIQIVNEVFRSVEVFSKDVRVTRRDGFHIGFVRPVDDRNGPGAKRVTPEFLGDVAVTVDGVFEG